MTYVIHKNNDMMNKSESNSPQNLSKGHFCWNGKGYHIGNVQVAALCLSSVDWLDIAHNKS